MLLFYSTKFFLHFFRLFLKKDGCDEKRGVKIPTFSLLSRGDGDASLTIFCVCSVRIS